MKKTEVDIVLTGEPDAVENVVDLIMDSLYAFSLKRVVVVVDNKETEDA